MEVDALEGALVEAFSDRLPRFAAVHQRTQGCLFLYARNAVEAVKSLFPRLPSVFLT